LYYIRYFFFIAWNWGIRLAVFTIYHEIRGEKKYNIDTSRLQDVNRISVKGGNLKHAEMYQGASYYLLEKVFDYMRTNKINSSMIDFGCGKGRAMVVAAAYGYKKVVGIDFASALCRVAWENINAVKENYPECEFHVMYEDVVNYEIDDNVNTFFFFNPFNEIIMKQVLKNMLTSLSRRHRDLYVIYINPQHKEVFLKGGFEEVAGWRKLKYIEAGVYRKGKSFKDV